MLPNFLSDINMRPIQLLKYILLLGILALSLVAKPSFSESSNMEKNSGSKNANQVVGESGSGSGGSGSGSKSGVFGGDGSGSGSGSGGFGFGGKKPDQVGFSGLFIQSFSIIVREGFEAILIIAALISFLRKSKNDAHVKNIHIGVIVGIFASFLTVYAVHEVLQLSKVSQEVLEGWIMLVSVVILFSVSYWLVSNIDNKKWQQYINKKMHGALSQGNAFALSAIAFISVYREGFETVLFYKALVLYAGETTGGILPGFLTGCVMLAGVFYLVNYLGMRVPFKWFFGFTSVLLYYMAFTFLGKGIHGLQMGEQFSMTAAKFLPNISWLGMYPTWETFIGQAILFAAFIFALVYTFIIKAKKEVK